MIDKHRPSKLEVEKLVRGTILYWFHIMQTFDNNLKEWNIPQSFSHLLDASNSNLITTNNYTERMNRTIESKLLGKQIVVTFIKRLYGLILQAIVP
ncbi:hypothetical protein Glove_78g185 [Diversispora epigaea]|uniref:Uncharacterized protein n=1 Tax=Diversispora epigaea TaxID=1348612 RepID=A0A397J8M7_9GLOM|nr:hypothetical protein Glove_78g185 [Diversispora epigaea]